MILLAFTGCGFATFARVTVNEPLSEKDVAFIVPGRTTLTEVVERLGTPVTLTAVTNGAVAAYHFRDSKYSRLNLGWPAQFFLPVSPDFIISGSGQGTDVFQITFDQNWVAQERSFAFHSGAASFNPIPFR